MHALPMRFLRRSSLAGITLLLSAAGLLPAAQLELQPLPPVAGDALAAFPKNVLRGHMGAQLVEGTAPQLLSDRGAAELPAGQSQVVIDLGEFYQLRHASLHSAGAMGTVAIALAGADRAWQPVPTALALEPGKTTRVEFPPQEARYVRLTFNASQPGRINGLSLAGRTSIGDTGFLPAQYDAVEARQLTPETRTDFNFAALHARGTLRLLTPGAQGEPLAMLDDDVATGVSFPAGAAVGILVALNQPSLLDGVGLEGSTGSGTLSFYTFESLPEWLASASAGGPFPVEQAQLAGLQPVAILSLPAEDEAAVSAIPETLVQYLFAVWQPDAATAPTVIDELLAYGPVPNNRTLVAYEPQFEFATPTVSAPDAAPTVDPVPIIPPASE